jgi:hypothetical protein
MEEFLEVLQSDEEDTKSSGRSSSASEDDLMLLAPLAQTTPARQHRTMRLHGLIDKHHVLILVDSGANSSFIDERLCWLVHLLKHPQHILWLLMEHLWSVLKVFCSCHGCVKAICFNTTFMFYLCLAMILSWEQIGLRTIAQCGSIGGIAG